jgi:hypothetical protein
MAGWVWMMNWKSCEMKRPLCVLVICPSIFREGLRKIGKISDWLVIPEFEIRTQERSNSKQHFYLRFVAFPATVYDEVLSGYQPGQMVEPWENQRFEDHLCPRPQGASTALPFDPVDSPRKLHDSISTYLTMPFNIWVANVTGWCDDSFLAFTRRSLILVTFQEMKRVSTSSLTELCAPNVCPSNSLPLMQTNGFRDRREAAFSLYTSKRFVTNVTCYQPT